MAKKDDKVANKKGSAQCEKIDKRGKRGRERKIEIDSQKKAKTCLMRNHEKKAS